MSAHGAISRILVAAACGLSCGASGQEDEWRALQGEIERVKRELKLANVRVEASPKEVQRQSVDAKVSFERALHLALTNLVTDVSDETSLVNELLVDPPAGIALTDYRWAREKARQLLDQRETGALCLVPLERNEDDEDAPYRPENGELPATNWIFVITDIFGDNIFWVIVPKDGNGPAYNYSFN